MDSIAPVPGTCLFFGGEPLVSEGLYSESRYELRLRGADKISEAVGASGVVEEYSITVQHDGDAEPTVHRIMAILTFGDQALSGERMYSDEKFFRFLIGPLWNELEDVA